MEWLDRLGFPDFHGLFEIICFAVVFYYVLSFFRGTRGAPILTGFVLVFIALIALTRFFRFDALNWLLERFSVYLALAILVIFQPEIRGALAELGKQHFFGSSSGDRKMADQLAQAVSLFSRRKIGALIALEQAIGLRAFQETGTPVDSAVSLELLVSIFYPYTPLHDGGVIVSGNRIAAAGCLFPLSTREGLSKTLGTRHRAAIGLTDETDAVVLVVSEETGSISVCRHGRLTQDLTEEQLKQCLADTVLKKEAAGFFRKRGRKPAESEPAGPVAPSNGAGLPGQVNPP